MKYIVVLIIATIASNKTFAHVEKHTIEELTIKGHKENMVGKAISASEGKISQADLAIRPLLRTGEILEAVPGMVATQHSGSGKANQYFLRGFNLDHGTDFATTVDGMPVNMRTHGHGQGYTDLNFIIPELVGEIAYHKGSYYADIGDFSGAGAADISTASALLGNTLSLGAGENSFYRGLFTGQHALGTGQLLYGLEHQVYGGPWRDINEDVGKTNLWIKQTWAEKENVFSIIFMGYDNSWNSADQIPARAVEQGLISELGSLDTSVGGNSSRYSLSADWVRSGEQTTFEASTWIIDYQLDLWSNITYFTDPGGDQFQQVDDRRIYGWDLVWSHNSTWGKVPVRNSFGSQSRYDDISEVGLLRSQARRRTGVIRLDAVDEWSTGLYWENNLQWTDALRTVLGVRYDYFHFDVSTLAAGDTSTLPLNNGTANDDTVTSSLSIIYSLSPQYEVYASIGEGFHSNDARGTTIQANPLTGEPVDRVNPLVETLGYEIGLRTFVNEKLNASIALWRLNIDSELLFVGDEGITEDTGVGSKRQGVELTAYYRLNKNWTLDLEYAYTDARFEHAAGGSDDIPGALERVISTGIDARFSNGYFGHLRVRHLGDYPLDSGVTAAASTLANLRLGYQWAEHFTLTLDVLNLLDSNDRDIEYYYESQLAGEVAPVADYHFHIFEPRSVRLYLAYDF